MSICSHLESVDSPRPGVSYLTVSHQFGKVHNHFQTSLIGDGQKSFCLEGYIGFILGPRQRKLCVHSSPYVIKIVLGCNTNTSIIHQIKNFQVLGADSTCEALGSISRMEQPQQTWKDFKSILNGMPSHLSVSMSRNRNFRSSHILPLPALTEYFQHVRGLHKNKQKLLLKFLHWSYT